jgi:hypothetical protein
MDAYSNAVALAAMPSKQAIEVVEAVVAGLQKLGLPRFLHMDHELSFRGYYCRGHTLLVRHA